MTDRYEKIRKALAMGPTPGPWVAVQNPEWPNAKYGITPDPSKDWVAAVNSGVASVNGEANARLIAACDPDTIRVLLAERDQLAAALEAAREDARKWRYWANGPQGTFLTDDLELAAAILAAYDKDDDWTVTDIVDPTEAAIDQARGKEVAGG